jgi:hypothetical protein
MPTEPLDPFRAWNDLALSGLRLYASGLSTGCRAMAMLLPPPVAARRRTSQLEMWPAAGSFGGPNAVAAWADATQAVLGVGQPRSALGTLPWITPMQAAALPWLALTPMQSTAWAAWLPALAWAMPGFSFGPPRSLSDPFRLMSMMTPMLEAFAVPRQRTFRYH